MIKFILAFFLIVSVYAEEFKSGPQRVNIIELYTSQGCSSCPRADEWLGNLKHHDRLFKDFIPLAFHITYWNFLGWKDIFSTDSFTKRQRDYSKILKNNSVYTPQFYLNAKEYKIWFSNKNMPQFKPKTTGFLHAHYKQSYVSINFTAKNKIYLNKEADINIAILGMDYLTEVSAGENKNRFLKSDFVVLGFKQHRTKIIDGVIQKDIHLPKYIKDTHKKILVVWISEQDNTPIQAVAGFI